MKESHTLPLPSKPLYSSKNARSYFGYKGYGEAIINISNQRDKNELYNISKDDVLGVSKQFFRARMSHRPRRARCSRLSSGVVMPSAVLLMI